MFHVQLQELRGNIRVFCRVRYDSRTECALNFPSDQDIMAVNPAGKKMSYSYDRVFTPQSTQDEVKIDCIFHFVPSLSHLNFVQKETM